MAIAEWAPERRRPTFSFYVTAHRCKRNPQMVEAAVDLADAVTVAGPEGPEVMRTLRESGLQAPVLFDGMGYAGEDLPKPDDWVGAQRGVGKECRSATAWYGLAGFNGPEKPKAQLTGWALS